MTAAYAKNVLSGMVFCGYCGHHLQRDGGYYSPDGTLIRHRFHCHQRYRTENGCPATSVEEDILLDVVFQFCKKQLGVLLDLADIEKEQQAHRREQERVSQCEEQQIRRKLSRQHKQQSEYYAAYKAGSMTKEGYGYAVQNLQQERQRDEKRLEELQKIQCEQSSTQPSFQWLSDCERLMDEN